MMALARARLGGSSALLLVSVLCACGGGRDMESRDTGPGPADGPAPEDAGGAPGEANIREALTCARPAGIAGTGMPGELELHAVDTAVFPDALCNDGTGAVLYYRPYRGEANRNRWASA